MKSTNKYPLLTSIKWLFASGALAAIVGLWGWLANKTIQNTLQTNGSNNTLQANVVVRNSNGQTVSGPTTITLQQVSAPVSGSTSGNPVVVTSTGSSRP
jgi:hypothetical protein